MRRKIYNDLLRWKQEEQGRCALLIDGARRVGKSYIVREFAAGEYRSALIIDFSIARAEVKQLFSDYAGDIDMLFMNLMSIYNVTLYHRESLVVFDEVQECPPARQAIKHLVADGRYDYIETGSLVSIKRNVKNIIIPSEERHITLYPMDFEEFLWAVGNETMMDAIRMNYGRKHPMGPLHRKAMELLRQYMIVGGMPQAVLAFVETKSFERTDRMKRDILALYKADIAKYATGQETHVSGIFDQIPSQLQRHERRFKLSSVSKGGRMRDFQNSFFWLSEAMTVNIAYNTTEPNVGLSMNVERSSLKCYMADTGLLLSMAFDENTIVSEELYRKLLLDKLEVNAGMLLENLVAQMLRAAGHKLYFYSNNSREAASDRMEVDFLISKSAITSRHNISPIEVKSGRRYAITSLNKMMDKYSNYLSTSYVIHTADYAEKDAITYLPVYMVPLL
ncbi:MAG: ATP-binding protein [Bacteroidales bacterium]|nr:ATP-binding protein [Bacteroidales bacterium]